MSQVKIAYLEISGRQTGKTERLAELGKAVVAQGKLPILVCTPTLVSYFRQRFSWMLVLSDRQQLPQGIDPDMAVWFYDEFDYLKNVVARPGAYYSTTPRYLRVAGEPAADDDVLLQLLAANGYRYDRYVMPPYISSDGQFYREHRLNWPPALFGMHMFGEFWA